MNPTSIQRAPKKILTARFVLTQISSDVPDEEDLSAVSISEHSEVSLVISSSHTHGLICNKILLLASEGE